ncbi:ABC transporter permease subunit [Bacillus sp. FJAT-45066]|uniref:ABC transporter permease subunit n=1 Tax=Bacillus sp. FJAT-45066 TaxID=2011010 RepID=UPI000BB7F40F|nr:ABC transporter permease [Bacillus sp. FJAT-45066]
MNLLWSISKSFLFFCLVALLLVLAVLIPRTPDIAVQGRAMTVDYTYEFSVQAYKHNISMFIKSVTEDKTLGTTRYNKNAEEEIVLHFSRSLKVIVAGFTLTLLFGILKGIYDFYDKGRRFKPFGKGFTWVIQSIPDFFLILFLQYIIIFYLPIIRVLGHEHDYSFVLPAILVSLYPMMFVARITSTSLANEEGKAYIQVARSKGLSKSRVLLKHMFRNSIIPIFSNLPSMMMYLLSNLLIVEFLLDYRGAAYRLFYAFDVKTSLSGGLNYIDESGLIIGIGLCFMAIVLCSQIISQIVIKKAEPR